MKNKRILKIAAAVSAAALLAGGVYFLFHNGIAQKISYEKLEPFMPDITVLDVAPTEQIKTKDKVELKEQIQELNQSYNDSIGWIYIPDTAINYPIMQSSDNEYYLRRAADGSYLYAGSLFLDYRCSSDFSDFYSIVYGHNMHDGTKFAELVNYKNDEYFHNHRYGWLTAGQNVYPIEFFAVAEVRYDSEIYTASYVQTMLSKLQGEAILFEETEIYDSDNMIMLSTCSGDNSSWRTVVAGKILKN